ncbi:hypothetical protein [Nostoc sp. UHCC 0251]|uniref:hypothetical protein n=1 Tax=Nostoc sp. UHCC 0251 TaxID=3110240 RepID=UPI002B204DBA|nr:hypothetical protein [Nostoc sp. UHCC 0251]
MAYPDDLKNCVGAARTSLRDAPRSLLPRRGTTWLSEHRRHRFFQKETPDALKASGVVTGF